jgi:HTH-type transcriptional regulator/antitoxin HigA
MKTRNKHIVPFKAMPPGAVLKEELEERGISQEKFSKMVDMTPSQFNDLINGKHTITVPIAQKLEWVLGIQAHIWLNMQTNYELDKKVILRRKALRNRI